MKIGLPIEAVEIGKDMDVRQFYNTC